MHYATSTHYLSPRQGSSLVANARKSWSPVVALAWLGHRHSIPSTGGHKGQYRLNKEEERDGRPQGPTTPHPLPTRPYDTTKRPAKPCIVGAGEDVDVGMGPLWQPCLGDRYPVRTHYHISSPYLSGIGPCGRLFVENFRNYLFCFGIGIFLF